MTRLMESTLSAARMQEGKIEVSIGDCDIGRLVQDIAARQQDIAKNHHIRVHLKDLPRTIRADAGAIDQILTNLLSNAVKYAPDAPDIDVVAMRNETYVAISVRDYGVGLDEEDLARVGERFFRAKTSTGIEGTGIGLNLVGQLVELHGGRLHADSKLGQGSTFAVILPIAGPDALEDQAQDAA